MKSHIETICSYFDLGTALEPLQRVHGGLLHLMWRLNTDKGSFAIKQLSNNIVPMEKVSRITERIASNFIARGIPGVCAIEKSGQTLLVIENTGYLAYPWVEAKALDQHAISEPHALKIATILAKMHCINLDEPEITEQAFYTHTNEKILSLIDKAGTVGCPFAKALRNNQKELIAGNEAYQNAIPILKTLSVVSHGDLDQKNVLWDKNNNPILVDWESACKINPTFDIINTAFYWSGITSKFNQELFLKMIDAYQDAGGVINADHIIAACNATFSWIGWLVYNIERSCVEENAELKASAVEQVNQTLATIIQLHAVIPEISQTLSN